MKEHDYAAFYRRLTVSFRRHPSLLVTLRAVNRGIVVIMYGSYLLMLGWLGYQATQTGDFHRLLRLILIPGSGFVLLSLVRNGLKAPRPYEQWPIEPLIAREKRGDSFPSRHVFSATVIAMAGLWLAWPAGVVLLVLALLLAVARVVSGVHYPRDVVAGMLSGFLVGSLLLI